MVDIFSFELAQARQRVKLAERSLNHANELLKQGCGVAVNISLCDKIRSEQQRLADAKQRLTKIDLTGVD
jgi:hypothetical protein